MTSERATFTKSEREYVKGIVHNLSFQRLTDQEITQWLHEEKQIDLDRSTVSKIRNKIEQQAEKWYTELKQSRYKYIATYKERIDSLLSYQKKLNQIIDAYGLVISYILIPLSERSPNYTELKYPYSIFGNNFQVWIQQSIRIKMIHNIHSINQRDVLVPVMVMT